MSKTPISLCSFHFVVVVVVLLIWTLIGIVNKNRIDFYPDFGCHSHCHSASVFEDRYFFQDCCFHDSEIDAYHFVSASFFRKTLLTSHNSFPHEEPHQFPYHGRRSDPNHPAPLKYPHRQVFQYCTICPHLRETISLLLPEQAQRDLIRTAKVAYDED